MNTSEYTYIVDDIEPERRIIHCKQRPLSDEILETSFSLQMNCSRILGGGNVELYSLAFDLIEIGSVLPAIDWCSKRKRDRVCNFHVSIPVFHPEIFNDSDVNEELKHILFWLTGDNWEINFFSRSNSHSFGGSRHLQFRRLQQVSLWSGGLDAYLGAVTALKSIPAPDAILLVSSGFDDYTRGLQRELYGDLRSIFGERVELAQVALDLSGVDKFSKNSLNRLRGFNFLAHGSAVSILEGHNQLFVNENGPGALNLHLSQAEVGLDHPLSVHPRTLQLMEHFVSKIFGLKFEINNSFLFSTKAEMCECIQDDVELISLALRTNSCDKKPRFSSRRCGICTSCLQRRQAFIASGITDTNIYLYQAIPLHRDNKPNALLAMLYQIDVISQLIQSNDPWYNLAIEYPLLFETVEGCNDPEHMQAEILALYARYVHEWRYVESLFVEGVLVGSEDARQYIEYRKEQHYER